MHKRHGMCVGSMVLLGVMLAGCAPTRLEMDYGTSYRLARTQQILLPEGEKNLAPQEGMDVKAAQRSLERYRKTFEEPPPPPTFALSVGAIK